MKKIILGVVIATLFACSSGQEEKIIVETVAKIEKPSVLQSVVLTDSVFTGGIEGPAVNSKGDLYVVNFKTEGTIGVKKSNEDTFQLFVQLPNGSVGNGIRFNTDDDMFIADYVNHNILKIETGTRQVEVFAHDTLLNQPNDLTLLSNNSGFASDPNWAKSTGQLWFFNQKGFKLLASEMGTTNGVEVSADKKWLYVNESIQRVIWRFAINDEGELGEKQLFVKFDDGGLDGMRCDPNGNLFVARYGKGVVLVFSPSGELIKRIMLKGNKPTNVTFNPTNPKQLFVTLQDRKWVEVVNL